MKLFNWSLRIADIVSGSNLDALKGVPIVSMERCGVFAIVMDTTDGLGVLAIEVYGMKKRTEVGFGLIVQVTGGAEDVCICDRVVVDLH